MSFTRATLFSALIAAAALAFPQSAPSADPTRAEYQPTRYGIGTAAPWGAGAVGGAAIAQATGGVAKPAEEAARTTPSTIERQGRSTPTPARRRSGITPAPSVDQTNQNHQIEENVPTTEPQKGTSDTSTQPSRPNPDSQEQGVGGGDTYDRNR